MKKDKRFSLRLRTYYLLIIAIVVIISFGAVVGALTALQQLGVIGHINVSTLVALLLVAAGRKRQRQLSRWRRVLAPMVKLSKPRARSRAATTASRSKTRVSLKRCRRPCGTSTHSCAR